MRRFLLYIFLVCISISVVQAEHIIGGDFSVQHVDGDTFEAKLTLFRDCASAGAVLDEFVNISIFDAVTNMLVDTFRFSGFQSEIAELGNTCFTPDICLEIGTYQRTIQLPSNPNGYYLTKERCCRNNSSVNLQGTFLGFVFTLDVPDPDLQNSSPQFASFPSEAFFCVNSQNYIDFSATDSDGDSLVYSLANPLNGQSNFGDPDPLYASPKPYSLVTWAAGYSINDQVGGSIPMTIDSQTGIISAQPSALGIFTIAVRVEEYRNGVKIGEIRRELQLPSSTCDVDVASEIITESNDTVFTVLANTDFCIDFTATDPNTGDTLLFQAEGTILDGTVTPAATFPDVTGFSSVSQQLCWAPICSNVQDEPYLVTLIAFSRGCANEQLITTQNIYIYVELEVDEPTAITGPLPEAVIDLYNSSNYCFDYIFNDPNEADSLFVTSQSEIFSFDNVDSLQFSVDQGSIAIPFCWNVLCEDVQDEPYFVDFQVITTNCEVQDTTNFIVPIRVIVPENKPTIVALPAQEIFWQFYDEDTFCADILVTDENFFDTLEVTSSSELFLLSENPASVDSLKGNSILQGRICWAPTCSDVRPEPYRVDFLATASSCKTMDTVRYPVDIYLSLPPENAATFTMPEADIEYLHFIGDDPLNVLAIGTDPDPYDTLTLTLDSPVLTLNASQSTFTTVGLLQNSVGTFTWTPACLDVRDEPYPATFTLTSKSCQKDLKVTRDISFLITTPTKGDIEPIANIISPNGDGKNDVWSIEDKEDPCLLNFQSVIYDRWGKEVYISNQSSFEWNAKNVNGERVRAGTYFQIIEFQYSDLMKSYSGNVQVVD